MHVTPSGDRARAATGQHQLQPLVLPQPSQT